MDGLRQPKRLVHWRPACSLHVHAIIGAPETKIELYGTPHPNGELYQQLGPHVFGCYQQPPFAAEAHYSKQSGINGGTGRINGWLVPWMVSALCAEPLYVPKRISYAYARPLTASGRNICFRFAVPPTICRKDYVDN